MTGKELRNIREQLKLTQAKFGEQTGLSGRQIRRLEADQSVIKPTLELLAKQLEALARLSNLQNVLTATK